MKKNTLISWLMLILLFGYMFALNTMMPLHRDDYEYALIWGTLDKIMNWTDVFQSLQNHYLTHGGRMVAFFVLDSFFLVGKEWFNPFNAFLFVALVVLIYWHSQGHITGKFNPYILLLTILFSWLGLPHFAEVNIWMTGACVYLMTAVFILTFLLPYHFFSFGKTLLKDNYATAFGMFFCGIIAGWTVENTAATMNLIIASFIVYAYWKKKLEKWMISGFCGSLLGFLLLVIAPGNYVRYAGTNTKFIYHFTNQLAAGGEMLLYVFPIIIFFVLSWRILLVEHLRKNNISTVIAEKNKNESNLSSVIRVGIIAFMLLSYLNHSFFSKWLGNFLYDHVAIGLGVATSHLKVQLFNTMSGLEEMVIYLLTISQIYRYIFKKLAIRKKDIQDIISNVHWMEIIETYPIMYYTAMWIAFAVINNLFMIASPTFPGRATFGSVVFLIIGTMKILTIPEVHDYLFKSSRKFYLPIFVGIIMVPMMLAVLNQHMLLYKENSQRMFYVEEMASQGAAQLELEPLSLKNRVLRHVYFVELNNGVSKYGLCRYYGLKDIKVKEQQ